MSEDKKIILEIKNLNKQYPDTHFKALEDFSLECKEGEIIGLLGHNGAGKSTTLKCITGILPITSGSVYIDGFDIQKDPVQAKKVLGFVSDKHDVFVKMTGIQYVNFMADAYGIEKSVRKERLEELDNIFELGDRINDVISDYSHGMKQKICMMGSLIHNPKLWILDEPMIGLDPITSNRVASFMKDYAAKGNCILFSSHNINSVEKICDRAVIIHKGLKTDDFFFEDFIKDNPNINLEDYFLQKTTKEQNEL